MVNGFKVKWGDPPPRHLINAVLCSYYFLLQPIGTTPMDTAVLKEPRGFIRCIEWLFAMVAFATCANFSTYSDYLVYCNGHADKGDAILVLHNIQYPFK